MSFGTPAPQPAESTTPAPEAAPEAPAAPAPAPAAGAPTEPPAVHPAWDQALAPIPPAWQTAIRDQIRTSETEHQRALEQARAGGVGDDWRALASEAAKLGLSPSELVEAYNGQQVLYEAMAADPDQFMKDISAQIEQAVTEGRITRREGNQLQQDAAGAATDLLTPEQQQIQALQQRLDSRDQQDQQQQQAAQQQHIQQVAQDEGMAFVASVHAAFDNDPQLAGATAETRQIAAQVAAGLLDSDPTGQLSYEAAVAQSLQQLRDALGWQGAPGQAAPPAGAPNIAAAIGGGGSGYPMQQEEKFDLSTQEGRDVRDAKLTAFIVSQNAQNAQNG